MRFCTSVLLPLLLVLAPISAQVGAEAVEVRLRLPAGARYQMQMTAEQQIRLPERYTTMNQRLSTAMAFAVVGVDSAGTQTLEVTYTHVALKQQGQMGRVDFDSDRPPTTLPLTAQPFAALVDQRFTVSLSPMGQVRRLEGLDKIVQKMLAGLDIGDGPAKAAMERGIREQFGPAAMMQNFENLMNVFPDGAVEVGDAWSRTAAMKQGLPLIAETTYTVKAITPQTVTLAVESKISPNPHAEAMDMGTLKLRYQLSGSQTGSIELDRATGWTRRSIMKQAFDGRMHVTMGEQTIDEPIEISGSVVMEPRDEAGEAEAPDR